MSITADPLFIAAEVQWRTQNLSGGLASATRAHHHGEAIRTAFGKVRHPHRHGRRGSRTGTPRIA